ncbi:hypothetical protein BGW38_001409 [Lunasporangiospora selenospora]|uniref:F-box domain-containing protein n=1 Tax=Lunasporangiospora selenospora TaxID=979761 RepID=A0A9P6FVM6_9FUNG|nr:hypothetical protein BGW38_001409 [Lunasporangiospora selenospora]
MFSYALSFAPRTVASALGYGPTDEGDGNGNENTLDRNNLTYTSLTNRALALPEILYSIGRHLDGPTQKRCLLVSRSWYNVFLALLWECVQVNDIVFCSHIMLRRLESHVHLIKRVFINHGSADLTGSTITLITIQRVLSLSGMERLQSLDISPDSVLPWPFLQPHLTQLSGLRTLKLGNVLDAKGSFRIMDILKICPRLVCLHFGGSQQNTRAASSEPSALPNPGNLVEGIDSQDSQEIFPLEHLQLSGLLWQSNDIIDLIRRCPELTQLSLVGLPKTDWDWTPETTEQLTQYCPKITSFHINPRYGSAVSAEVLTRLLERLPKLVSFKAPRCEFNQDTFEALRRHVLTLQELDLSFTRKPGLTSPMLMELMAQAIHLRYLDSSGTMLNLHLLNDEPKVGKMRMLKRSETMESTHETESRSDQTSTTPWGCDNLEVLKFGFQAAHPGSRGVYQLCDYIGQLTRLQELHILPSYFPVQLEEGLIKLETLKNLRVFSVHPANKPIQEEVVKWIGTTWPKLKTLRICSHDEEADEPLNISKWLRQVCREDIELLGCE